MASKLRADLDRLGYYYVRVDVLPHPMDSVSLNFDMQKFSDNQARKVLQVGGWYRQAYSIYNLPLPARNPLSIHKAALKGKNMESLFKPEGPIFAAELAAQPHY